MDPKRNFEQVTPVPSNLVEYPTVTIHCRIDKQFIVSNFKHSVISSVNLPRLFEMLKDLCPNLSRLCLTLISIHLAKIQCCDKTLFFDGMGAQSFYFISCS